MRGRAVTRINKQTTAFALYQQASLAIARSRRLTAPTPHPALRATFPRKGGRGAVHPTAWVALTKLGRAANASRARLTLE
jgi:hypothetical protein